MMIAHSKRASPTFVDDPLGDWLENQNPALMTLHNILHRRRQPWQGRCAGKVLSVSWAAEAKPIMTPWEVFLLLGDAPVRLRLSAASMKQILSPLALKIDVRTLPSLSLSLLVELALLDLIETLEPLLGQSVQVLDTTENLDQQHFSMSLALALRFENSASMSARLDMTNRSGMLVAQLLEDHGRPLANPLPMLSQTLTVVVGWQWLNLSELRSLLPGDVVMLERWSDAYMRLDLQGRIQARCEYQNEMLRLQEELKVIPPYVESMMTENDEALGIDSTLNDLQLKLVCQVGSLELSLAQLRELGVGSLLQLNAQTPGAVDLMVNGRRVGQGELLKIGDGLGVRLLSFATP